MAKPGTTFPRHLLYDPRALKKSCPKDVELGVTADDIFLVKRFFAIRLSLLGRKLQLRQRCISTAVVYFRRFYLRHSFRDYDPRVICAAALFLASKVEENPAPSQHICLFTSSRELSGEALPPIFAEPFTLTETALGKAEFVLLEGLSGHLLVEQPHSHIEPFVTHLAASSKLDPAAKTKLALAALSAANDSLRTDAALLFPPRAIAVACVLVAAALQGDDCAQWADEVLGGGLEAAAALAVCPLVLAEYREFADREVELDEVVLEILGVVSAGSSGVAGGGTAGGGPTAGSSSLAGAAAGATGSGRGGGDVVVRAIAS